MRQSYGANISTRDHGVGSAPGPHNVRSQPASREGRIVSLPVRQGWFGGALAQAHHRPEDDRVRMALDELFDHAIEGRNRVGENGSAGREGDPLRAIEAARSMGAAMAAEAMGERLMAGGEQADRERSLVAQSGEGRG